MVLNMSYLIFGGDSVSLNQILKIPNLKFFYSVYGIVMTFDPPCTTLYLCLIHKKRNFHTYKTQYFHLGLRSSGSFSETGTLVQNS